LNYGPPIANIFVMGQKATGDEQFQKLFFVCMESIYNDEFFYNLTYYVEKVSDIRDNVLNGRKSFQK